MNFTPPSSYEFSIQFSHPAKIRQYSTKSLQSKQDGTQGITILATRFSSLGDLSFSLLNLWNPRPNPVNIFSDTFFPTKVKYQGLLKDQPQNIQTVYKKVIFKILNAIYNNPNHKIQFIIEGL